MTGIFFITINTSTMADLKRRTLYLSSGRQIKLYGDCVAINKSLEIGEGYAPNILSLIEDSSQGKTLASLSNPHKLTIDELMDLADFNIQLWMDLKAGLRKYGQLDPRVFGQELSRTSNAGTEKSEPRRKRKTAAEEG
jgi:hypothetical protein